VLKGKTPVKSVKEYREIPDDEKKGLVNFTETQKRDVFAFLKLFPDISVETRVYVDDDEDDNVYEGDLCTVEVTITRNHLAEGEKAGLVHAPFFPYPKKEAFWVILGQKDQGKIISIDKIGDPRRVVIHRIKFMAPPVGKYEFDLLVKSNAYVGMDESTKVTLETKDNSALPEYKVHPDDAELDDEPTLFEEMLGANIEQDSDDEDSDEEEVEDDAQESSKRKAMLRKARHEEDSDDDDDDAEEVYTDK
jgi:translocation protein SEC63